MLLTQNHSVVEYETQVRASFIGQLAGLDPAAEPQSDDFIATGNLYRLTTEGLLNVRLLHSDFPSCPNV
jgi:hypothetical protein